MNNEQKSKPSPGGQQLAEIQSGSQKQATVTNHSTSAEERTPQKEHRKPTRFDAVLRKIKSNPVIRFIIVTGALLTFLAGLIASVSAIKDFVNTTFFRPDPIRVAMNKIEGLAPGVNISFYEDKLGKPTFTNPYTETINAFNDQGQVVKKQQPVIEYIFVDRYFYVKAFADNYSKVIYYAVTTRNSSFHPVVTAAPGASVAFQITLGKSTFSDIPVFLESLDARGCLGGHHYNYYEAINFGRPSQFQSFGFEFNEAGYTTPKSLKYISELDHQRHSCSGSPYDPQELEALKMWRTSAVINTYAVSASFEDFSKYTSQLGVYYEQVRMLESQP